MADEEDAEYAGAGGAGGEEYEGGAEKGEEGGEGDAGDAGDAVGDDLEEMQRMMEQLEEDNANIISASSKAVEDAETTAAAKADRERLSRERDERSVFVGNVDLSTEEAELAAQFESCGAVEKVLLVRDRAGHPKGFVHAGN